MPKTESPVRSTLTRGFSYRQLRAARLLSEVQTLPPPKSPSESGPYGLWRRLAAEDLAPPSHTGMKRMDQLKIRRIPVLPPPDPIGRDEAPASCDQHPVACIARACAQRYSRA